MSEDFHTVTSTWTDSIEKVIKKIGESCEGYKWMNIFAAKKFSTRYNILMYALIFIGPISGILSTLSTAEEPGVNRDIQIMVTIFSFLSGVISSIIKFSKFEQRVISHKTVAAKYASLEGNVRRQLSLYRNERVNAGSYLEWVSTSYDELFTSTPLIPEDVYRKWTEVAKNNNLTIPDQLGNVIEIAYEEQEKKKEDMNQLGEIGVNKSESKDNIEEEEPSTFEVVIKGQNTIKREMSKAIKRAMSSGDIKSPLHQLKRQNVYDSSLELNRYADSAMMYELKRMHNHV